MIGTAHATRRGLPGLLAALLSLTALPALAETRLVPDTYPTLQAAVDAAADGDTILIGPGVYQEHLALNGRSLTFQSTHGPDATVIDGGDSGRIMNITGGTYTLIGLTLAHGNSGGEWGGAINMEGGAVFMDDCTVRDNRGYSGGVTMFGRYASTRLVATNSRFLDNHADGYGPAVTALFYASFTCDRCRFERNWAGGYAGAVYAAVGYAFIRDSVFYENGAAGNGGAVYAMGTGGYAFLERCILAHNSAGGYGGAGLSTARLDVVNSLLFDNAAAAGGALASVSGSSLKVASTTVVGNHAPEGGGVYAPEGSLLVEDSIVQGNDTPPVLQADVVQYSSVEGGFPGTGNIDVDCLFTDAAGGDFTLAAGSPCIDAANPGSVFTVDLRGAVRPQGLGFDMGAFETAAHLVTASAGAGGSISPSGTMAVVDGAAQAFAMTPDPRHHVTDVLVDGVSVGAVSTYVFDAVSADHSIPASFAIDRFTLAVTNAGTGSGTVTSAPTGIDCGATCSTAYDSGATVTLTALPAAGSFFAGWGGACSGTGPCTVTMDGDRAVTATFTQYLTVTAPNGGEAWSRGSTQVITWRHAGAPGPSVRIELVRGSAVVATIARSAAIGGSGAGSYRWRVPDGLPAASGYRIRITSTSMAAATDLSDGTFRIR